MGVNDGEYNPATDVIISNASCTTNWPRWQRPSMMHSASSAG